MSLTLSKHKSICLSIVRNQKKQSFDERICDDLCEVILQYLPLKDKLRLECVSKQFQRNIFQKQNCFWFNRGHPLDEYNEAFFYGYLFNDLKIRAFEMVLKKCPNIKSIVLCFDNKSETLEYQRIRSEQIVSLIDKYCNNLIEFNSGLALSQKSWNKLIPKINSKTFTLYLDKPFYNFESLSFVKQLKILSVRHFKVWPQLLEVNNILKTEIIIREPLIDFQRFVDNNKSLKYLNIEFLPKRTFIPYPKLFIDEIEMVSIFNNISKIKNLIELKIDNFVSLKSKAIFKSLKQISVNCIQLKSISFEISYEDIESGQLNQTLKLFKNLKRLNLILKISKSYTNGFPYTSSHTFKIFKGFSEPLQLTHLTIKGKCRNSISLERISDFLPKLRVLTLNSCFPERRETDHISNSSFEVEIERKYESVSYSLRPAKDGDLLIYSEDMLYCIRKLFNT